MDFPQRNINKPSRADTASTPATMMVNAHSLFTCYVLPVAILRETQEHYASTGGTCLVCRETGQVPPSTTMDGFGVHQEFDAFTCLA
jgi:hypothetical protein